MEARISSFWILAWFSKSIEFWFSRMRYNSVIHALWSLLFYFSLFRFTVLKRLKSFLGQGNFIIFILVCRLIVNILRKSHEILINWLSNWRPFRFKWSRFWGLNWLRFSWNRSLLWFGLLSPWNSWFWMSRLSFSKSNRFLLRVLMRVKINCLSTLQRYYFLRSCNGRNSDRLLFLMDRI